LTSGKPEGSKVLVEDIRKELAEDPELQPDTMSEELKSTLIAALERHREAQDHGVRASNKASALSYSKGIEQLSNDVSSFHNRINCAILTL
jgi:hypothetical protein